MKSRISSHENGIDIDLAGAEDQIVEVEKSFQDCRAGRCSCPSAEYEKIESLEIDKSKNNIRVSIKTRAGENVDVKAIASCLEYTLNRAEHK